MRLAGALVRVITARSGDMRHPEPETAARFVLVIIGLVLRGVLLADHALPGLAVHESALEAELVRMMLGYLGVETED